MPCSSCTVHVQFQTGSIHQVGQVAHIGTVQYNIANSCAVHVQFMYIFRQIVSIKWVRQLSQVLFNIIQLNHVQLMYSSFKVHVQFMYSFRQVVSIKWVMQLLQVLFNIIQLVHVQFLTGSIQEDQIALICTVQYIIYE